MQFFGITAELFFLLLAALGGGLVLAYLVKLRRRRVSVPFSPLWAKVLSERKAHSAWQRIKRWLSLLLQLLILFLLLVALRDPRAEDDSADARNVLVVIDTSASMATRDGPGGRDRMEIARQAALSVLDGLGQHDHVMVVQLDDVPRPLTPFDRPSAALRARVSALGAGATSADPVAARRFAARSLAGRSRPELVFVSDFAFAPEVIEAFGQVDLPINTELRLLRAGGEQGNLAITGFNVRRYLANRLNYEVFVTVESSFDLPVTAELTLTANGRAIDRLEIELAPHGTASHVYGNLPTGGSRLEASLEIVGGDAIDRFSLDDRAFALLPRDQKTSVLLVSGDNLFVEAPLLLNQNLTLSRSTPSAYDPATVGDVDVVVFNDVTAPAPEGTSALYIHPDGPDSPWAIQGQVENPIIDRFARGDALMRWMHGFRSLNVLHAQRLDRGEDDTALAWSIRGDPMFMRRDRPDQRLVAVAFRIEESDFALRTAYPLFLLNAVDWLADDGGGLVEGLATGRAHRVRLPPEAGPVVWLRAPDDTVRALDNTDGAATVYPQEPGFHGLFWSEPSEGAVPTRWLAANLFDPAESRVAGAAEGLDFELAEDATEVHAAAFLERREPWVYLLLLAAVLLVFEWVSYNRRVTV